MAENDYPAGALEDNLAPFNVVHNSCDNCGGVGFKESDCICTDKCECVLYQDCTTCEGTGRLTDSQIQDHKESHLEDMGDRYEK